MGGEGGKKSEFWAGRTRKKKKKKKKREREMRADVKAIPKIAFLY